jgi:hypothetical protein
MSSSRVVRGRDTPPVAAAAAAAAPVYVPGKTSAQGACLPEKATAWEGTVRVAGLKGVLQFPPSQATSSLTLGRAIFPGVVGWVKSREGTQGGVPLRVERGRRGKVEAAVGCKGFPPVEVVRRCVQALPESLWLWEEAGGL